jgi:O-methyltransferase
MRRPLSAIRRQLRGGDAQPGGGGRRSIADFLTPEEKRIVEAASPFTITSVPRLVSVIDSVRYCTAKDLPGAFAECGVWRGGSVLAMVLTLQELGREDRDLYLYDTFEGMTAPGERDVSRFDPPALETWRSAEAARSRAWSHLFRPDVFSEADVRDRLLATGYPEARLHFVRGPVEETLPEQAPREISLLRLDTDWYESTRHELEHLYPRLTPGGVLIVDDYGHWEGCRRAVDEYFAERDPLLLHRIDYSGRLALKQ